MLLRIIVICLFLLISSNADTLKSVKNNPIIVAVNIDTISSSIPINLKLEKGEDENVTLVIIQYATPFLTTIVAIFAMLFSHFQTKRQIAAALITSKDQINTSLATSQKQLDTSLEISKQQIHSQVLSANRQVWINSLREAVSELLSELARLVNFVNNPPADNILVDSFSEYLRSIVFLRSKITLLINPDEDKSKALISAIELYVNICTQHPVKADKTWITAREKVIKITQEILKEEWERVKNLE